MKTLWRLLSPLRWALAVRWLKVLVVAVLAAGPGEPAVLELAQAPARALAPAVAAAAPTPVRAVQIRAKVRPPRTPQPSSALKGGPQT